MENICRNCIWWDKGECGRVNSDKYSYEEYSALEIKPVGRQEFEIAVTVGDVRVKLITGPEFGCVLWEQ